MKLRFATIACLSLLTVLFAPSSHAGEEIRYTSAENSDFEGHGYLSLPEDASSEHPALGVLVIHEWWGHNDYARRRADHLAEAGYAALAIDMYGEGQQAKHPEDAGKFAAQATSKEQVMKERFLAGMKALQARPEVDQSRIVSIGYCMGGMISLQMAAWNTPDLIAAASFHGALNIDFSQTQAPIAAQLLVCHGADDSFIPEEVVERFQREAKENGATLAFHSYEGAVHSFTNPEATAKGEEYNLPLAYNEAADRDSWQQLMKLLQQLSKSQEPSSAEEEHKR